LGAVDEIGARTLAGGGVQSDDHDSSSASAAADTDVTITD
jgi:hypothetical protein